MGMATKGFVMEGLTHSPLGAGVMHWAHAHAVCDHSTWIPAAGEVTGLVAGLVRMESPGRCISAGRAGWCWPDP
ncbi:hypothetical protein HaLaN_00723 [Haematococcus lacustris]|uniref:Uncharacterized protein n=1 Tax=Haematococcus lacustris TaxID=44745 RepID=A0A699YGS9_HAELA|nr:hypothetical protein HaLaN_00723 [Haematococcus lacustris]